MKTMSNIAFRNTFPMLLQIGITNQLKSVPKGTTSLIDFVSIFLFVFYGFSIYFGVPLDTPSAP